MWDDRTLEEEGDLLADYDRWLHSVANRLSGPADPRHDDLVQEGRVAMWHALRKHDPSKGSLPSWLTKAAEMRMKNLAWGKGQPTGHEARRGVVEAKATASTDEMVEEGVEALLGAVQALTGVEYAYHHGEIMQAINDLSPMQRRYVYARFWLGIEPSSAVPGTVAFKKEHWPEIGKTHLWAGSTAQVGAKERLATALAHMAG
jgi:RNA polymerase sigma factor (sigma-70 family)